VDIGIWLVVSLLSEALRAPTLLARYSRLLIDLNRSLNCSTCMLYARRERLLIAM
jgi:predicted N-formylglutamate amidohydrolase